MRMKDVIEQMRADSKIKTWWGAPTPKGFEGLFGSEPPQKSSRWGELKKFCSFSGFWIMEVVVCNRADCWTIEVFWYLKMNDLYFDCSGRFSVSSLPQWWVREVLKVKSSPGNQGWTFPSSAMSLMEGPPGWFRKFQLYRASVELVRVAFHRLFFVGG